MAKIWKFSKPVLLASGSPRRRELLSEVTDDLTLFVPDADESSVVESSPSALVEREAELKMQAALAQTDCTGKVVISADTIVYLDKKYGKPSDLQNAVDMLTLLCGRWHEVYTGVCIAVDGKIVSVFYDVSKVKLKSLSKKEILDYVMRFKPLDKAGAYAIQENTMVETYEGDYSNVVGLPMIKLENELRKCGAIN